MKQRRSTPLFLALVLVSALLFSSVPTLAGDEHDGGRSLAEARQALEQQLRSAPGFVGIAHSEEQGEIVVFLENAQAKGIASARFGGFPVRTEVTGRFQAHAVQLAEPAAPGQADQISPARTGIVRPLMGGTSVSAYVPGQSWAGTLGMVTYDNKILSNAHVIAMDLAYNFLATGTPVIQPATGDGGVLANRVGELEDYILIDFSPGAVNYADAAIASIDPGIEGLSGWQFGAGTDYQVSGTTTVSVGDMVRKSGRTTGVTTGEVAHANATVSVNYGGQWAYFDDQIMVYQQFSQPGDSGSAVDKDGEFVGLVFAGSKDYSIVCKAEHIIAALGIAVEPTDKDQPQITLSPASFDVPLDKDTVWTDTLTIGNTGAADLTYDISLGGCPWLHVTPDSGSIPPSWSHELTVTIDTSGLDPGEYSAEIAVTNNDPGQNPTIIPVKLEVSYAAPTVSTRAASEIGNESSILNMDYTMGDYDEISVRFAYRMAADAAWAETPWVSKSEAGSHAETIAGLEPDSLYYFKAQLEYNTIEIEGIEQHFTTAPALPDLIISEKYEEWVDFDGRSYNITYTVKNEGSLVASTSTTSIKIDGVEVTTDPVPSLGPGDSHSNTFGPFILSGDFDVIGVCADRNGEVEESDDTNNCLENTWGTLIFGVTADVNCSLVAGVIITLYENGNPKDTTTSDEQGTYTMAVSASGAGTYHVLATREGFRTETRSVFIEPGQQHELHVRGNDGLVPNQANLSYVLDCIDLWLYPPDEVCGLSLSKVLDVIDAWLYPIVED